MPMVMKGGGYDEILLPADVAGWKGDIGAVENAILDDELQAWAQGLLSRGVRLIGLLDACHSATGFRALGGAGVARGVDGAVLGIPDEAPNAPGTEGQGLSGDFVFLYSSQSDQRSFEYPLADGSAWHGEFTLRLAEVLARAEGASWAQVLRATSDAMVQGPARQVPDGEGPMLADGVFGMAAQAERYGVAEGQVLAGLLQGLGVGDEVGFFADATGGEILGTAVLIKVTARAASLSAAPPPGVVWAERITPAPPLPFVLAAPVQADGADYAEWRAVLAGFPIGEKPDLVPILVAGGLALAGPEGVLDPFGPGSSPRVVPEDGASKADALAHMLDRARHAQRLRRVFADLAGRSLTGKPALDLRFDRRPAGDDCAPGKTEEPTDPAKGLAPCDQLWLHFTNISGKPQDVSILYFNADFTVTPIWPNDLSNRLMPGETARAGMQMAPNLPPAVEELMVLAVPASEDGARVDLTRLATPEMSRSFAGAASPVEGWIEDRMQPPKGETSRGFSLRPQALMMIRQVVRVTATRQ